VLLHVRLLVEALAAVLARVGPRVRVDEQVRGQRGRALEALAADLAVEASFLLYHIILYYIILHHTQRDRLVASFSSNSNVF